ncbi:serine/threonine-protein kinase [Streptomyces filamentosus]|uniref:serine/threonine-protein kinase n=1 Tax=Streptomyces filamentosus TaxID=67294 RepID=UPI0012386B69|nr:serine/threonine-protein kinase [Streptomyces filamentosus]KAA6215598.1 serine/threonine protein kinase [Streptomyces filamentosus]
MDPLRVGRDPAHIGDHLLLGRLGVGGMGQVYLARSPGGGTVALKVIREEITGQREVLARFRREVATVRAVRSPHTAQLVGASLDEPPYWLATEYVPGPTLRQAVAAEGAFVPEACRRLFEELAVALADVHAYGVTHRDLKPQNVILAAEGPRLIDFGIARGLDDTALTRTGAAPGTPGFTAPEVLLRNETSAAADVFALGATMAYVATGRPPFGDGPAEAVSYRAVHEDIDLAGVGDRDPELLALILDCVAKDPADRPALAEVIARCSAPAVPVLPPTLVAPDVTEGQDQERGTPTGAGTSRRGRGGWGRVLVVLVLAGWAGTAAWQAWNEDEGDRGTGSGAGGGTTPSGTPGRAASAPAPEAADPGPPAESASEVRWALSKDPKQARLGAGECDRPSEGNPSGGSASTSVTYLSGASSAEVGFSFTGEGTFRLVAGVKPPGGKGFGHTTRPMRVGPAGRTLVYPRDFPGAPPVTSKRGDWTVVVYRAETDDRTEWKRFGCTGFRAARSGG